MSNNRKANLKSYKRIIKYLLFHKREFLDKMTYSESRDKLIHFRLEETKNNKEVIEMEIKIYR